MAKVLIADGETNFVLSLEFLIKHAGLDVITADNGAQALKRVHDSHPDLVLLDVNLPDISGFEVLERLRGNAATTQLPIIMLTARGRYVDREKGLALGADDYITKPFSTPSLLGKIKALLSKALLIKEQP